MKIPLERENRPWNMVSFWKTTACTLTVSRWRRDGVRCRVATAVLLTALVCSAASGQESMELDLSGKWEFRIGDDLSWTEPSKSEPSWGLIDVPGSWENEGYAGYDGFAWYRKSFKLSPDLRPLPLYLVLGQIDDIDEVYLNGRLVGSRGTMPPFPRTAFHEQRAYRLPSEFVWFDDENVITVRVYDMYLEGGIITGPIGIFSSSEASPWIVDLTGSWKFMTGDDARWSSRRIDDSEWPVVSVPANWEPQGFRDYDGYAWYRKDFYLPADAAGQEFVLQLGKIDDVDAAYVNGVEIGRTGDIDTGRISGGEWQRTRRYRVAENVLEYGGHNTVAVRVYDAMVGGGIFDGEVGLYPADVVPGPRRGFMDELLRALFGRN